MIPDSVTEQVAAVDNNGPGGVVWEALGAASLRLRLGVTEVG
jgi:hypothetical protein